MDNLVGPWKGHGGTSWDDETYHGVRETATYSSLYYPHEHIFGDSKEKVKKIIDVGPWGEYSGTNRDDGTYHGEREIILKEKRYEKIEVGLWGGNGGTSWDDGTYNGVREIALVFGHCIDSICVVYDKNGMPLGAEKHGGVGGYQTTEIKLESSGEYLVGISGYYSPMVRGSSPVIRSLTFKSNKRTFGPFGMEQGTPFSSSLDGGRITGFKGRSGQHLDAIGLHVSQAKPPTILGHTISFPKPQWLDSHIQGMKLAAPAYYGHPRQEDMGCVGRIGPPPIRGGHLLGGSRPLSHGGWIPPDECPPWIGGTTAPGTPQIFPIHLS